MIRSGSWVLSGFVFFARGEIDVFILAAASLASPLALVALQPWRNAVVARSTL